MSAIKKDLNFFTAYKSGAIKMTGGFTGLIALICAFVLIVAAAYGAILFFQSSLKAQIKEISNELSAPGQIELQEKLTAASQKNVHLSAYHTALTLAKGGFDGSRVIDAHLFNEISSCIPEDVVLISLVAEPQSVRLSARSVHRLSPAVMTQALYRKNLFSAITYDGVAINEKSLADADGEAPSEDVALYHFNLTCVFGEG